MSFRIQRVNELISQELLKLFSADFPGEIISINFVNTQKDLSIARIYFSVLSENKSVYNKIISRSNKYWQELSKKIIIKRLPRLYLIRDEKKEQIEEIEKLIEINIK